MRDLISIPILILLISNSPTQTTAQTLCFRFTTTTTTCNSLIDYKLRNTTTLSTIATLFQIKNLRSSIAANNLPPTTPPSHQLPRFPKPQNLLPMPLHQLRRNL